MSDSPSLKISNLSKTYGNGVKALDDLSLEIGSGMFGLLGPNGAGKSTLMRTIATLQAPDTGSIRFDEIDVIEEPLRLRQELGYLPQNFGVYPKTSAEDLLSYFCILKGVADKSQQKQVINHVLDLTNLSDVRNKNVDGFSGGMKQRFGIAQLLLNNPSLIIVDEPTAGLDPAERNRFLNVLREIATNNVIIFSTHIVDDVKDLCHEMAVINQGKILLKNSPDAAISELDGKVWSINCRHEEKEDFESKYTVLSTSFNSDNSLRVRVYADQSPGEGFEIESSTLEDVYFMSLKQDQLLNQE